MTKEGTNHEALFLSRLEAAKRLNVSVRSVDRAIARGELKSRRFGARVLVPVVEIERYAKGDNREETHEGQLRDCAKLGPDGGRSDPD